MELAALQHYSDSYCRTTGRISRFFDVAHTLVAMVPTKEGTLFFYVNRFWVDYWNGLVSVRRAVGKQVMAGRMKKRLEKLGICK